MSVGDWITLIENASVEITHLRESKARFKKRAIALLVLLFVALFLLGFDEARLRRSHEAIYADGYKAGLTTGYKDGVEALARKFGYAVKWTVGCGSVETGGHSFGWGDNKGGYQKSTGRYISEK